MTWISVAFRLAFVVALAALLGWMLGYTLEAVIVVLALVVAFWQYQMQRVQSWLNDPGKPPPDAYGIWGELVSRIYLHQRKHVEVRAQLQSTIEYLQDSFAAIMGHCRTGNVKMQT